MQEMIEHGKANKINFKQKISREKKSHNIDSDINIQKDSTKHEHGTKFDKDNKTHVTKMH